ncbi:MAG: hypothetical protein ABI557_21655, partial [Aureliella sp.]
ISNYVPRTISGSIVYGDANSGLPFVGLPISLSGTDLTGAAVSKSTTVGADGSYKFDQLAPGNYQLSREPLAFINDAGATVNIQSGVSDGDMVSNLNVSGALKVGYFDIRDFLGSTTKNSLTVAVKADGTAAWIAPRGDWAQLTSLQANLNTTTNTLTINAANATQSNLQASVPLTNNSLASVVGQDSSMQLLRVRGSTARAGLAAAPPASTSTLSSTGDTSSTQGLSSDGALQGEGEGAAVIAPTIETSPSNSQLPPSGLVAPTPTTDGAARSVTPLSPSEALRQLLGSSSREAASDAAGSERTSMTAADVDEAMQSLLPSMQLQLSDDLSDTLARSR